MIFYHTTAERDILEKYGVKTIRPLLDNTMRRVIRGVDKFTIKSGAPFIVECNHSGDGHTRSVEKPSNTITGKYTGGICEPVLDPFTFSNTGGSIGSPASDPVHTIRTAGGQIFCTASLIQYHTEKTDAARVAGLDKPVNTVDASNRYGLSCANLVEYYGNGNPIDISEPMHTVTAHDREAVVSAHIQKYFGGVVGADIREPLPTVTAVDHNAVCAAHIVKFNGQDIGYWPDIRKLLNKYCGYRLQEDEIVLLVIGGVRYYISDITLRMLTPRELYNAMGFPSDYIINRDYLGNAYPKSKQVARCGNAVCPPLAEAMVRANFPERSFAKCGRTQGERHEEKS